MSQRETQLSISLQQWRGVNQRTSPTLVQDGFFVMSRGVFFGLGENAERIPGKKLSGRLPQAIFQIYQFGDAVLIQTFDKLWHTDVQGLLDFDVEFLPVAPPAPNITVIGYFTVDMVMPAALPDYTNNFAVQRSLTGVTWTTIVAGLAALQNFQDTGLNDLTQYRYRLVSVGSTSTTPGPAVIITTLPRLPDAPAAPTYANITSTGYDLTVPAMPPFGLTMDMQRSPDDATWTTVDTGLTGGEFFTATGEASGVPIYYRMIAFNARGSTIGPSSSVTPNALSDARLTRDGDFRVTIVGDFRTFIP